MSSFRFLRCVLLAGSLVAVLAACGNKGPLVKPSSSTPPVAAPDATPAPAVEPAGH